MRSLILVNTREWLRLKFMHVVFFLTFIYIIISYLLGSVSFVISQRIVYDLGLAGLEISTFIVAAFFSTHALFKDVDRKTIQVILSRPIPRWNLLVGYVGSIFLLNLILISILSLTMFLFFGLEKINLFNFIVSLIAILFKSVLLSCLGVMLGTLVRPMFGFVLVVSYWVLSYSIPDVLYFAEKTKVDLLILSAKILDLLVAKFYLFNWKSYYYLTSTIKMNDVLWALSHLSGWSLLFLFLGSLFIKRKDLV